MSAGPLKIWQVSESVSAGNADRIKTVNVDQERTRLLERERAFSAAVTKQGSTSAYGSFAADELRLFRNGTLPFVGKQVALSALVNNKEQLKWEPTAGDVSRSGDLGYTYGTYETIATDAKNSHGSYLHIWWKQGGVWRIVLDVTNPLSE
jgi:hypothetical protein